jgi:UDP-2-acetamido-3-amino-2,3-dideoxy-glucuronate N-acetyltransferase
MNLHTPASSSIGVADLCIVELPCFARDDGEVVVAEVAAQVPFAIERMFTLTATPGARRGDHAHRLCSQFIVCVHGAVDITCDDGSAQRTFKLDRGNQALLVPPMIWNTVDFVNSGSVLVVLCDRLYETHDYIRDHAEFVAMRGDSRS